MGGTAQTIGSGGKAQIGKLRVGQQHRGRDTMAAKKFTAMKLALTQARLLGRLGGRLSGLVKTPLNC